MKPTYSIVDWDENYENANSRKIKNVAWVPLPNKHDGKRYRRLISRKDGAEVFAAWVLILQIASKCPVRGVLSDRDGAIDALDMATMTGLSEKIFENALKVLSSKEIGWLASTVGDHPVVMGDHPIEVGDHPAASVDAFLSVPSVHSNGETQKRERPPDPIWDTIMELWPSDSLTEAERGRRNKVVAELKRVKATPDDIRARYKVMRQQYKGDPSKCTPAALMNRWSEFAPSNLTTDASALAASSRALAERARLGDEQRAREVAEAMRK